VVSDRHVGKWGDGKGREGSGSLFDRGPERVNRHDVASVVWRARAARVASSKGTRRGEGSAPAGGWKQGKTTGERTCPGKLCPLGEMTTNLRTPGAR
jgi:hypothetical protein